MPSLQTAKQVSSYRMSKTIGQIHKENSDMLMELTWDTDVQSRTCYIYDYFHDDQPSLKDHMTYDNTTKTKIEAKFIIKSYQSLDKDRVEYYLQFRPSQKFDFNEGDELYYAKTDYIQKYHSEPFIGLFVDVPDDNGIYHKWIICEKEIANQFPKFLILPINYLLTWVEFDGNIRICREMWSVIRSQTSYTIGQYTDYNFTRPDNQDKLLLPLNPLTEKFWYNSDINKTMRLVVSAPTAHPIVWAVTKVENVHPLGILRLTLYQQLWNEHTDYIDPVTNRMYADYFIYANELEPINPNTTEAPPESEYSAKISADLSTIKVGGTYKLLTVTIYDSSNNDITEEYANADFYWTCKIDDTEDGNLTDYVSWLDNVDYNQRKIKFPDNRSYLGKILYITCNINGDEIITTAQFELITS
jgi:hypothetical protein